MHTWGSNLSYHPHIHVLCTGGGLDTNRNWHQKKGGFFLSGKAMAALFKGKFLSGLKALHEAGKPDYKGEAARYRNQYEYQELPDICYGKNWVTDIRESFAGAETVMHYLGRYTPDSDRQQPNTAHGRGHRDHKGKGSQERRPMEGADPEWHRVRPPFFDACPSEKFCQDTSLWDLKQPEQAQADPYIQEPDRLP